MTLSGAVLVGCHGHEHGNDGHAHDHGHEHTPAGAGAEAEPEPIAITRWTDRYELFVELPPPVSGKKVSYHAHVTRLSDFAAVTEGRFTVQFRKASAVAVEHTQTGVKRPGIFVFEGDAPGAGDYQVEMTYEQDGHVDSWDCGTIAVLDAPKPAGEETGGDEGITFLKESQWKIPFGTAWVTEHEIADQIEVAGVVEPAGPDQLTLGAPTSGRFLHDPKLGLAEGLELAKGAVVGSIVPTVAGEDYSRLVFGVEEARIATQQNAKEIERIKPLVEDGSVPRKRLIDLENEAEVLASRLKLARERAGTLGSGAAGGVPIRAELGGQVAEVLVGNGETVAAGAPLVRLGGERRLWVRTRFFPKGTFEGATPTWLRTAGAERIDLAPFGARLLSGAPTVDPDTRVATWVIDLGPKAETLPRTLRSGTSVVATIRFGQPEKKVAVERSAIVEINTRPYAFVQIDGEHFQKRQLSLGKPDGDLVPVLAGLEKGERVVTKGGFDIHLAAVMGTVESHRH